MPCRTLYDLQMLSAYHMAFSQNACNFSVPGAGKTSALRALERLGGYILDCDALYHEMLRTDAPMRSAIVDAFGDVFTPDGALDRQKLGSIVFSDAAALERLNAIVYRHLLPESLLWPLPGLPASAMAPLQTITQRKVILKHKSDVTLIEHSSPEDPSQLTRSQIQSPFCGLYAVFPPWHTHLGLVSYHLAHSSQAHWALVLP